jgi:hypothetical protein
VAIAGVTETAILQLIFNAIAWANYADNAAASPQTNIAIALHTADPGTSGNQATSEATYTGYARASVARTVGGWTVVGVGPANCSPVSNITFPVGGTGAGSTLTNFTTGKTGGGATPILWSGTVTPNIVAGSGVTPVLTTATTITLS